MYSLHEGSAVFLLAVLAGLQVKCDQASGVTTGHFGASLVCTVPCDAARLWRGPGFERPLGVAVRRKRSPRTFTKRFQSMPEARPGLVNGSLVSRHADCLHPRTFKRDAWL